VHHLVAISLLVFAVLVVAGTVLAGVRGLAAWRALKSFRRTTGEGMLVTAELIERLEARTAASAGRAERIGRAQAQLQESLAEAAVIGEAAGEVWTLVQRARLVVPRS
jgi:hypothetical protein